MRPRRVGVVSGDQRLFVDLALRGRGLELANVDLRDPGQQDVVLVDVPPGGDAAQMAAEVPRGPAVVVLTEDVRGLEDMAVVRRPCTVEELVEALHRALPGRDPRHDDPELVVVVDEPAPVATSSSGPALATSTATAAAGADGPAPTRPAAPMGVTTPTGTSESASPTEVLARRLRDALARITSLRRGADTAAAVLAEAHAAEHVALWARRGDDHVVLGATGLSDGARGMRLPHDHPVVQLAQGRDGTLVHDEAVEGSWAPGLPGSRAAVYVMLDVAGRAGPVDLVTAGGQDLDGSAAVQLREVLGEVRGAWPASGDTT